MRAKLTEWRLHAGTAAFRRRVDDARRIAETALRRERWALSWSTGKDSTAMTHLVHAMAPEVPILTQFDDCDWPSKEDYARRVADAMGWTIHRVDAPFSVWDRARECRIGSDDLCAQSHDLTQQAFLEPLRAARIELGCTGVFLGLRCAESRTRRINLASRGATYETSDGWRCCPLMRWSATDVFAYHVAHGIEINPLYLLNRIREPEDIRISWALPTPGGLRRGDMEHMRVYFPGLYRRLREII